MAVALTLYNTPTRVLFGSGATSAIVEELAPYKVKKILVHYGSERIKKSGLLDKIVAPIIEAGIQVFYLSGVVSNPRLELAKEGIAICKENDIDFCLAIGGGSVIDSAKCICYGAKYEGEVWDFFDRTAVPVESLPLGTVLTIAAAGSEMSNSCVITNWAVNEKRGCASDLSRPKFSILDPEFTYTLPLYETSAGTTDIMMHTLERYFAQGENFSFTNEISFTLIKEVMKAGKVLVEDLQNPEARAVLMWASSLSHNGLTNMGNTSRGDWASHALEHELSGYFDVLHGAGLAAIWPAWARYISAASPTKMAALGKALFDIDLTDESLAASATIDKMEDFFRSIKMPTRISQLGITLDEETINTLAESATFYGKRTVGAALVLGKEDIVKIFNLAK